MNLSNKIIFYYWLPCIVYAATIYYISGQTLQDPRWVPFLPFWKYDKVIHFTEFGILGLLLARALKVTFMTHTKSVFFVTLVIIAIYASIDEWHQSFVPNRVSSVGDVFADVFGAAVFSLFYFFLRERAFAKEKQ